MKLLGQGNIKPNAHRRRLNCRPWRQNWQLFYAVPDTPGLKQPAVEHDNIRGADYFDSAPEADPPVIQ